MDVILIVIGAILAFYILRYILNKIIAFIKRMKKPQVAHSHNPNELITAEDCNRKLIQLISNDFAKIGWTKWSSEIHNSDEQLKRLEKATRTFSGIHIVRYNELRGIAKIEGTSGNYYLTSGERCSCPDYRKRLKPCKHMYKLATDLADEGITIEQDNSIKSSTAVDNVFGGLCFAITGRNQAATKEFITKHSGRFSDISGYQMTALVLSTDTQTQKRTEAIAYDVEIMTFEQLQNLFDIFH